MPVRFSHFFLAHYVAWHYVARLGGLAPELLPLVRRPGYHPSFTRPLPGGSKGRAPHSGPGEVRCWAAGVMDPWRDSENGVIACFGAIDWLDVGSYWRYFWGGVGM